NTGLVKQTGTGGITFSGIVTNNSGGVITQNGASGLMQFTLAPVNGGLINQTNAGPLTFTAGATNNSGGNITEGSSGVMLFSAGVTNNSGGTITEGGSGLITFNTTLSNTGLVQQTGTGGITFTGIVTNNSGGVITQNGPSGLMQFTAAPVNAGLINQVDAGPLTFSSTVANNSGGTISQASTVTGSVMTFALAVTNSSGGTITQDNTVGGTMTFTTTLGNSGLVNQTATNTGGITFSNTVTNAAATSVLTFRGGTATFTATFTNGATANLNQFGPGTVTFNNTFTNSGTVTQTGGTIVFPLVSASVFTNNAAPATFTASAGSVTFSGAGAQSITNLNTTTPVTFNNLNISVSGTKTLVGAGKFIIASSGVITLSTIGNTIFNPGIALLTLSSNATSTASVATLPPNTSITGSPSTISIQRYITGGNIIYRGYRLLSSPVQDPGSGGYYSLGYLIGGGAGGTGSYISAATGTGGGFDVTGNPSMFLYRESATPSNASFTSGNYRGIEKINNTTPSYSIGITGDGSHNLGVGNGLLYFYRGNTGTSTSAVPNSLMFTSSGVLNQGPITVTSWVTGTTNLSYTAASIGPPTDPRTNVVGYNLVGNPYPSTIDWNTFHTTAGATGILGTNLDATIYTVDPTTQGYATYLNGGSTNSGSRYIASGQGFFVHANAPGAQLTFYEDAKVPNQPSPLSLNASTPSVEHTHLRLQLAKDSVHKEDIYLGFAANASTKYVIDEDAPYRLGNGTVSLSSFSSDNKAMAINFLPLPKGVQTIPLNVLTAAFGTYKLNLTEISTAFNIYDVWLKDNYTKDSLDIKHNPTYTFNIKTDTATYGANRFKVVIRLNALKAVHLLSFTGVQDTKQIKLTWTSENEENYTTYVLQRSIDGGHTFTNLDSLTSANLGTYNDLDPNPVTGINLYRLKQVDVTGSVSYSAVLSFAYTPPIIPIAGNNNAVSVYPNPVKYILGVVIKPKSDKPANYKIIVTNNMGIVIKTATTTLPIWLYEVANLLPGTYFVNVTSSKDNSLVGRATFIKL
ncbi:MAG: hypothetical protein JWQ34_443, partial [Mucilaginibacter sp.]|uniref:hypothetical protein n=1 Tax=Mucilaginibacter sp. TaxID=1882438 RepID=UPI0026037A10